MSSGLFKDVCGRGTNAARPNPTGTDRQYYDGYLYEQTDSAGSEPAGFYRYDGVGFVWRLLSPTGSLTSAALSPAFEALADGATITWAFAGDRIRNGKVTLGGNRTLSITGAVDGSTGTLMAKQDGTGSRTLILPAGSKVINTGGGAVTLSSGANKIDCLTFIYDGTNYFWTIGKDYN